MTEEKPAKLSREQLYNEIWEISVSGVSKKYDVPYAELLKLCKENDIPIPPSGYWIQLKFGKPVTKTLLPESAVIEVELPANSAPKRSRRTTASAASAEVMADPLQEESSSFQVKAAEETEVSEEQPVDEPACVFCGNAANVNHFRGKMVCGECATEMFKNAKAILFL